MNAPELITHFRQQSAVISSLLLTVCVHSLFFCFVLFFPFCVIDI